jgi:putative protease
VSNKKEISLFFHSIPDNINWQGLDANRVYIPIARPEHLKAAKKHIRDAYLWLPAVLRDHQMDWVIKRMEPFIGVADGVLAGNMESLRRVRTEFPEMPVALDFQINVLNSWTVFSFETYSPSSIVLSPELNINEIRRIKSPGIPLEVYVYGEIPVMTMEYCPGSGGRECMRKCLTCDKCEGYITDRAGKRFLYRTDPVLKRTTLFNSSRLMLDDISPLKNTDVDILRIGIMDESNEEISILCDFYAGQWIYGSEKLLIILRINCIMEKVRKEVLQKDTFSG